MVIRDFKDSNKKFHIDYFEQENDRVAVQVKIGRRVFLKFEDKKYSGGFTRKLNNSEFFIENSKIILKKSYFKTDVLKPIKKDKKLINKFLTLDVETMVKNEDHIPYCVCHYNGKEKTHFYLTDYSDSTSMLRAVFINLLKLKIQAT